MAASRSHSTLPLNFGWCDTDMTEVEFSYIWTIKKFSYLKQETGECIESSPFAAIEGDKNMWRLRLFPKGDSGKNKDYITLDLKRYDDESQDVSASFEFSILNNKGAKCFTSDDDTPHTFSTEMRIWGYAKYIRRVELIDQTKGFMHHNELVIRCDMVIFKEIKNSDGQYISIKDSGSRVLEDLGRLLENKDLSDIILVAQEKEFHAHKAILAARSPVFAAMFKHNMQEKQTNRVEIPDLDYNVIEELIRFIYTGKIPAVDEKMTSQLLAVADKYGVDDLKLMCEKTLVNNVNYENIGDLATLASLHNADLLKKRIVQFIKMSSSNDVINRMWMDVISQHPQLVGRAFQENN